MDIDFIGVKIGDVNGTAVTSSLGPELDSRAHTWPLGFEIENISMKKGQKYYLSLSSLNYERISGWQGTFEFDSKKIIVEGIKPNHSDISDTNFDLSRVHEGFITFSIGHLSTEDISDGSILFDFDIKAKEDLSSENLFRITSTITDAEAYRGYNEIVSLELLSNKRKSQILNVHPNPWVDESTIVFTLEKEGITLWEFFNAQGKQLYHHEQWFDRGENYLKIDSKFTDAIGVIYIKMKSDSGCSEYKMMKL